MLKLLTGKKKPSKKIEIYAKNVNKTIFKVYEKKQYFMEILIILTTFQENLLFFKNKPLFVMCPICTPCFEWINISFRLDSFVLKLFSLYSECNKLRNCTPLSQRRLPFFGKLEPKLNLKKRFQFQHSSHKKV